VIQHRDFAIYREGSVSGFIGKQAVVVGAGMGGLTAARALADYFENVVVLERDSLPTHPTHRVGTPQAQHVHVLLTSGYNALTGLFPNFGDELTRAGAVQLRAGFDVRIERPGYDSFPQRDLGWPLYSMSRPLRRCPTIRRSSRNSLFAPLRNKPSVLGGEHGNLVLSGNFPQNRTNQTPTGKEKRCGMYKQ
jgi:hypothetical protein